MMTPQVSAMRIARELQSLENDIDALIAKAGALAGQVATARVDGGYPAATGHRAILKLLSATQKAGEIRSDLVRAHEDLRHIAETADFPTACPPQAVDQDAPLRVAS
ncbi:hypothetical protein [Tsuneonella amylolytica]|uniref:hypothetical protein n=1 Tax=Tsuneonella amylolytica TaxID=2338327 RepID=UPI0013C3E860|nr:hypothetical protein [Tsuneonella amylolytica]